MRLSGVARWLCLIAIAVFLPAFHAAALSDDPPGQPAQDTIRARYYTEVGDEAKEFVLWQILELALQKNGQPYDLDIGGDVPAPERFMADFEAGKLPDAVAWIGTSPEFEQRLLPVRVPVFLGLMSYHGLLIKSDNAERFAKAQTLDDLRQFTVLMGRNWGVIPAFEDAGFTVITGAYQQLTDMIAAGRGDFLPQSLVLERTLLKLAEEGGIGLADNTVLYYPSEMYFFVSRDNPRLHDALLAGMKIAIADGSYEALLRSHPDTKGVFDHQGDERRLIRMENSHMTEETRAALQTYSISDRVFPYAAE